MIDPKNVSFDKHNKPSLTGDAMCTIVESVIRELGSSSCGLSPEAKLTLLEVGTRIVQKTQDTINRVLDGEASLVSNNGMFTRQEELTAIYTNRTDSSLAIGKRVSVSNTEGLLISGSYLTIV